MMSGYGRESQIEHRPVTVLISQHSTLDSVKYIITRLSLSSKKTYLQNTPKGGGGCLKIADASNKMKDS
jgi:hypothetical protein